MRWSASKALGWIVCQKPVEPREWTSAMGRDLRKAQDLPRHAIAEGRVQAWGRPSPHSPYEKVLADQFRIKGAPVGVGLHGEMFPIVPHRPYTERTWHSVEFCADEIKKCWPAPPSPSATNWILARATRTKDEGKPPEKRDALVDECARATGCTTREAVRAYQELPREMRRCRGKPRKHSE
jgi:hypothetical protein